MTIVWVSFKNPIQIPTKPLPNSTQTSTQTPSKLVPNLHPSPAAVPELLQGPVVGGPVLLVLHLDGHDGAGEVPCLAVLVGLGGQQVLGQRGVQRVRQQHELELDLGGPEPEQRAE